jgi:V-type H+-transporting ATPase proteolipid subunit
MGCTSAIVFACFGAAYGTAKAGVGVSAMGVLRPDLIVKSTLPPYTTLSLVLVIAYLR